MAIDLPGFGLTPPRKSWSLESQRDTIIEVVSSMGHPVTLIGNSMGGLLSEMVASARPELVDNLVLIAPATPPRFPDPRIHWPTAVRLALNATPVIGAAISRRAMSSLTPRRLIEESLDRITHDRSRVPLDMVESFVELAKVRSALPWAADAVPMTGAHMRAHFMRRSEFVRMIRRIKAPTLIVQGTGDRLVSPTSVEWLCSLRLDWTLVQMDDTGHTPQIDAPIRLLSVVGPWLEAHLKQDIAV
jgi:pimeloyl-ACP methyl ester carboxylesterase